MGFQGYSVLAVIPARGGSKSIPRKNLVRINGISLVGRAARVATGLRWIDSAILSTDDMEIAEEGRACGLDVPFMRPEGLSGDSSNSIEMWRHAWLAAEDYYQARFDISILLEPTSPLRREEDIDRTVRILLEGNHASAITVSPTPAHFTPQKTLIVSENGLIEYFHPSGSRHSLRQSIPPYFHRNGLCYAVLRETLVDRNQILDNDCAAVIVNRPIVNIDDPMDLKLAKLLIVEEELKSG